jgi:hypothetical protein
MVHDTKCPNVRSVEYMYNLQRRYFVGNVLSVRRNGVYVMGMARCSWCKAPDVPLEYVVIKDGWVMIDKCPYCGHRTEFHPVRKELPEAKIGKVVWI